MVHVIEHFIQKDILRTLSRKGNLPFSALKPPTINNSVFAYHLKALVNANLVIRNNTKYFLSAEGVKYVGRVTRTNLDIQPQPKVFCFLIIEKEDGEFLLHRRHAQPFLGKYTFPGGTLFFDEGLSDLVQKQLLEKTGFALKMEHKGIANLRLGEAGIVTSHTIAHLFYGRITSASQPHAKDQRFAPEWVKVHELPQAALLPDVLDILSAIQQHENYFFLDLHMPS
ncbi:MAG TPA: NUDIX hydrolase [Candidatus Saccharimonadales bacterium]|nr:NUDIX hydrolase [Candidatus Saccharimonadales bacterium]